MHPYCPAMPSMEGIVDLTQVPNMGVALLSCITKNEIIRAKAISSCFLELYSPKPRRTRRFAVSIGWVDC